LAVTAKDEGKEDVDLKLISSVTILNPETLQMLLLNGDKLLFQGAESTIKRWHAAFGCRLRDAMKLISTIDIDDVSSKSKALMSGWLMKKSNNKLQTQLQVSPKMLICPYYIS
jgi:hypothetical protein